MEGIQGIDRRHRGENSNGKGDFWFQKRLTNNQEMPQIPSLHRSERLTRLRMCSKFYVPESGVDPHQN